MLLNRHYPKWKVYGTDISSIAIKNAQKNYKNCIFFPADEKKNFNKKFDFLFSHHVLEHVSNLCQIFDEINEYVKNSSAMMHICPCGNKGSFEYTVCSLRKDGINSELENRFFFEDEGHLRRLNTEQLNKFCAEKGFILEREYYGNQYYGAINWITKSGPSLIKKIIQTSSAIDEDSKSRLRKIRNQLIGLWILRYPAVFIERRLRKKNRTLMDYTLLSVGLFSYLFAKPIDLYIESKSVEEWQRKKTEKNGSEMYLYFGRLK